MTLQEILAQTDIAKIRAELAKKDDPKVPYDKIEAQLDPLKHEIFDVTKRKMKKVKRATGKDAKGNTTYSEVDEDVNRIAVPFQEIIVNRANGFVHGIPVSLVCNPIDESQKKLFEMVKRTWEDNKLDFFNRSIGRMLFTECEVAELWYFVNSEEGFWENQKSLFKLKCKLLSQSNGDSLYPHYDANDSMDAFSRGYTVEKDGKKIEHFDVYTDQFIYRYINEGGWKLDAPMDAAGKPIPNPTPNSFKKIPIVYYKQDYPEWYKVQSIIDRFETIVSNFGDTNDYFGAPMVKTKGKVLSMPDKSSQGKVIQLDEKGDADYMAWNQAPEAIKLEFDTLKELIYSCSQTPDISFSQMKGLGNLSGIALKLMFLDAHMKAENHIEVFGEMYQRRLNLIKQAIGNVIDISLIKSVYLLKVEPKFTPYLPKNVKEEIDTLSVATGGKAVLSVKTSLENNPLVSDPEGEMTMLEEETVADLKRQQDSIAGSFNP